jgi:hypothetical protein
MSSVGQLSCLHQVGQSGPLGVLKLQELLHLRLAKPRSSRLSSSIWTAFTGRSSGGAHSGTEG